MYLLLVVMQHTKSTIDFQLDAYQFVKGMHNSQ